jgi:ABC-type multidrug transport system fused ATPase/permease subunit
VLLVPLLALAPILADRRAARIQARTENSTAADSRLLGDLFRLATTAQHARELRVYGLTGPLAERHRQLDEQLRRATIRSAVRSAAWEALGWIVFAAGFGAAVVVLTVRAVHGEVTVGQVVMAVSLIRRVSGGQWHKLALARGLMRRTPLLTVLDEPTASLDAAAESALFARYTAAADHGAERGAVTVLVSHRFSSVRTADLVVVVEDGQVREVGSHDDLLGADGLYARMHQLQASAYQQDPAQG